jgi:aminopeptidase
VIDADAFAVLLADWCLEVAPNQQILIDSTTLAQEPAAALHRAVLERGAWPLLRLDPPGLDVGFYRHARDEQLDAVAPIQLAEINAVDATIRIHAPADPRALATIDPALIARRARALGPYRRARSARRWALSIWPTPALAQTAGMPEQQYAEFLTRALFLDHADPIAQWQALSARQQAIADRLASAREVHIETDRTDLRLNVAGRRWINSDGRRNMPSGEIFTSPLESSANGSVHFDVPSMGRGAEVSGVDLKFVDGEVVAARAEVGDEHLQAALAIDVGARRLGELGIGTNTGITRATGSTLLDEKIAGTIHLALGNSYPEAGGLNESALHWDLICDLRKGGRVTVDGDVHILDGAVL